MAHFSDGDIVNVTFAFQPILPISIRPIRAPPQLWAPTTLKVGLVGIVLGGCKAGGAILVGKRFIPDLSHIETQGEVLKICTLCILHVSKALNTIAVSFLMCLSFMFSL